MTIYTETRFDRAAWQSVPVANWTFEATAPDRLTVTRNGESKTVRIIPDGSFVVALRKTYIRAAGGAEGLYKTLAHWAAEAAPSCWLEKVLHWAFESCKAA